MIRTRNQIKTKDADNGKIKNDKKNKKSTIPQPQTDTEDTNPLNLIIPQNNIAPNKSKKVFPRFEYHLQQKDQAQQYEQDIILYLKEQQPKYKIDEHYLKYTKSLNNKIRCFLIKYIFKIGWRYKCKRSTLYLAVYCMDYYLSKVDNLKSNVECVTVAQACLNLAMKHEEIYPPRMKQWTTEDQIPKILDMEAEILKAIEFKLNFPSITYFEEYLRKKFCQSDKYKQREQNFYGQQLKIKLISDLCLFDVTLYEYSPFDLAINIRRLVYNQQLPFSEERVVLNIKWALQRNKEYLDWLKQTKYKEFSQ